MYRTHLIMLGVLSANECVGLRALEPELDLRAGTVTRAREERPDTRRSQVAWLQRSDDRHAWLFERIDRALAAVNAQHFDVDYAPAGCAAFQYSVYGSDEQGHYAAHMDDFLPATWPDSRKLSFVAQLSAPDEYDGGDLRFRDLSDAMPAEAREQGTLIVFPSILYHAVTPVTTGTRRSLVGWYSGPPWR